MNLEELSKIINGTLVNKKNILIKDIKIDSKQVKKNDLFICIKGKTLDGHDFINEAIKNKVGAIITSKDIKDKIPYIKVEDTLLALEQLAIYKRSKFNGITIAITGSVGKTSTKEILKSILETRFNVVSNKNSNNNIIGLPLTIFDLKEDTDILLTELGMNHIGEIKRLSNICKPYIAIITNIGSSHIGNLKTKRNIFKAKMEITGGIKKGHLIVNGDDKYLKKLKPKSNYALIKCGLNKNNDFTCSNVKVDNDKVYFDVNINNKTYHFTFNTPSIKYVNNLLLVINTSLILGIDIETIKDKISNYNSFDRRLKIYNYPLLKLIDDSYNSSLESLKASLEALNKEEKKLLIIGDIKELGKYSKKIHKKIGKLINLPNSEVLIIGNEIKVLSKKYKHFNTNKEIIDYLENKNIDNYTVLIKGSNSLKLNEISKYLHVRFDR